MSGGGGKGEGGEGAIQQVHLAITSKESAA